MYAKEIPDAGLVSRGGFMRCHISLLAKVKANLWTNYGFLEKDFENLVRIPFRKREVIFRICTGHIELKRMAARMHHHL